MSDYAEAAHAFAVLRALDLDDAQRRELRAAGVAEHRVHALYGRPFPTLVPYLMEHLKAAADEDLLAPGFVDSEQVDRVWAMLPKNLFSASDEDDEADDEDLRAQGMTYALADCIADRWQMLDWTLLPMAAEKLTPTQISGAIWSAHWLMSHRDQLPPKSQARADEIMVSVARTIALCPFEN